MSAVEVPTRGRLLGVDPGSVRIGVAVSNDDQTVATPLEVIDGRDRVGAMQKLVDLVDEWEIVGVVVGDPRNMDGTVGPSAKKAAGFRKRLGATIRVPIVTYDERLTTVSAHRNLGDVGLDSRQRAGVVDMVAAQVILQGWLDQERR